MTATNGKFIQGRLFKIIVLVVYIYSFIQLDADESPIQINLIKMDDPFAMEQIQIQVERPIRVLIKIFGKDAKNDSQNTEAATAD